MNGAIVGCAADSDRRAPFVVEHSPSRAKPTMPSAVKRSAGSHARRECADWSEPSRADPDQSSWVRVLTGSSDSVAHARSPWYIRTQESRGAAHRVVGFGGRQMGHVGRRGMMSGPLPVRVGRRAVGGFRWEGQTNEISPGFVHGGRGARGSNVRDRADPVRLPT